MAKVNTKKLYALRQKLKKFVDALGGDWYASGTDHITEKVDFSFDLDGRAYSVHIKELIK